MDAQALTLAHPKVQAAKEIFNKRPAKKGPLDFDALFELFASNVLLTVIAKAHGVTHQAISRLYNKYFRELFGGLSVRERKKADAARKKIAAREKRKLSVLRRYGYILEQVPAEYEAALAVRPGGQNFHFLQIAGINYLLAHSGYLHCVTPELFYLSFRISKKAIKEAPAVVFYCLARGYQSRFFVVPSAVLRASLGDKKRMAFYLPLEKRDVYRKRRPRIEFWQYENAWHLLKKKP